MRATASTLRRTAATYPTLAVGVVIVSIVLLITLTSPWLAPFPPMSATPDVEAPPPDLIDVPGLLLRAVLGRLDKPVHWFGTDASGLDIFSRVLTAPRTDLVIAISANAISMVSDSSPSAPIVG